MTENEFENVTAFSQLYRDIISELYDLGYMEGLDEIIPKQDIFTILFLINVLHHVQKGKIEATKENVCFAIYCVVIINYEDIVCDGIEVLLCYICRMKSSHEFKNAYIGSINGPNGLFIGLSEMDLFVPFLTFILNTLPHQPTLNQVLDSDFACLTEEHRLLVRAALGAGTVNPRLMFDPTLNDKERWSRLEETALLESTKESQDLGVLPAQLYLACTDAKQSFPSLFAIVQRSSVKMRRVVMCYQGTLTADDYDDIVHDKPSFYAFLGLGKDNERSYWPGCTRRMAGCDKIMRFSTADRRVVFGSKGCLEELKNLEYGIAYFRKMGMENECTVGINVIGYIESFREDNLALLPPDTQINSQENGRRFITD